VSPSTAKLAGSVLGSPESELVLVEWRDPGGERERPLYIAPLHVHHEDDEAWYVVEGRLSVRLDDADVTLPAGGAVLAPRGTRHTYWNPGPEPLRYVLAMTPRLHRLIEAIHAMSERSEEALAAVFSAHRSEYLGWP
jgi:mannose-6-phosphate isomerase-like protein (cupin superfamily)